MSAPVFLDMTRATARCWNGSNPTGIDRVCDAYAAHFAHRSIAVIQIRGRAVMLNRASSDLLMDSLELPQWQFRRALVAALTMSAAAPLQPSQIRNAFYINVGHSDFDLEAHWRWVQRAGLRPLYLLHDLIPITNPSVTTPHKSERHRGRVESAIRQGAGIVVNSQSTADALQSFARDRGLDIPSLLVAHIASGSLPKLRPNLATHSNEFVAVGTVERRKNPHLLLRVWSQLVDRMGPSAPKLVFAGSLGKGSEGVLDWLQRSPNVSPFVKIESDLDDRAMAKTIASARGVLLPSFAEGYGIPLVEALERGVPVIGSKLASFQELGQGIPTLLDPQDDTAWVEAITDFCSSGPEYQRQIDEVEYFRAPSWSHHFDLLEHWMSGLKQKEPNQPNSNEQLAAFA